LSFLQDFRGLDLGAGPTGAASRADSTARGDESVTAALRWGDESVTAALRRGDESVTAALGW
jgi:hypothetical protein